MLNVQSQFRALSDPTRRAILMHLSDKEMSIGELTGQFKITRAAIKKHLNVLENGRLISVRVSGRERINRLEPAGLKSVSDWLSYFDNFWNERLNALGNAIENEKKSKKKR